MTDIEKRIAEVNAELSKKYRWNQDEWISVSKIKEMLKVPFDKEGTAKKVFLKQYDDPQSQYFHKSVPEIIDMWERKAETSKTWGKMCDTYIEKLFNGKKPLTEEQKDSIIKWKLSCVDIYPEMSRKFKGVDDCLSDFKNRQSLRFECREQKLMMPFEYKGRTFVFNGRFDAVFSKNGSFLLVDWKNSEDVKSSNNFRKMLGPCGKLDDCDLSEFGIQTYFYLYLLKTVYGITEPLYTCIVQFPAHKDYFYRIHRIPFDYDPGMMEAIFEYSAGKRLAEIEEREKADAENKEGDLVK